MSSHVNTTYPPGYPYHDIDSSYNYRPTEWICILFVTLFILTTIAHTVQALRSRLWYFLPTMICGGIGEIIGWSARLYSSIDLFAQTPFIIQISCTIFSPTFISGANFLILGTIIQRVGTQYSRVGPKIYALVFMTADTVALIVQAVGGSVASSASNDNDEKGAEKGANIMLGGIVVQLVAITIYVVLAGEFAYRVVAKRPVRSVDMTLNAPGSPESGFVGDKVKDVDADVNMEGMEMGNRHVSGVGALTPSIKLMLLGLGSGSLFLFIRSIYRTIELSNGWSGRIISTQVYFNVLDGMMVFLSMFILNVLHPGYLLK